MKFCALENTQIVCSLFFKQKNCGLCLIVDYEDLEGSYLRQESLLLV